MSRTNRNRRPFMTSTQRTLTPAMHPISFGEIPSANTGTTRQMSMTRRLQLVATHFSLSLVLIGPVASTAQCDWGKAAPMSTARQTLGAARGGDGLIYAVGGDSGSGNTVEALNPRTGKWSSVPPFPTPRGAFAVTAGKDGKIYVIGGINNNGKSSVVEAYTPATKIWTRVTDMPTPRMYLAAATGADGKIYALGGIGASDVNTVEVYTPQSGTWTTAAPRQFTHSYLAAATGPDGRIYAIGGINNSDPNSASGPVVETYLPATNSWSTVSPMINGRYGFAAVSAGDKQIYVFGGEGGIDTSVEAYDPVNDVWNTMFSLPVGVGDEGAATGVDGRIYVLGGNPISSFSGSNLAQTYSTGFSWSPVVSMPTDAGSNEQDFNGSRQETASALGKDGNIYVLGGNDGNA